MVFAKVWISVFSPNSFTYRGSYFKQKGWGFADFWGFILGRGAVGQGVVRGIVRCSIGGVYGGVYADFLDSFWGGCRAECCLRCSLMFNWCEWDYNSKVLFPMKHEKKFKRESMYVHHNIYRNQQQHDCSPSQKQPPPGLLHVLHWDSQLLNLLLPLQSFSMHTSPNSMNFLSTSNHGNP